MAGGDQPIIVGGPHMITVQLPERSPEYPGGKFSIAPEDPAIPFKTIVVTDGAKEVFRWELSEDWKITIA